MRRTSSIYSSLSLHGFHFSQPTRSVKLLLTQNKIPYDFKVVDALKGENRRTDFLKLHPAGLVPVIVDGDFVLGETCAIMSYLAETRKLESFYPNDFKVRARINFWLHWHHGNTRLSTKQVLVPSVLFPPKINPEEVIQKGTKTLKYYNHIIHYYYYHLGLKAYTKSIMFLENHLKQQGSNKFVAGTDTITIADLILITELDQLVVWDLFDYKTISPNVDQYMKRVGQNLTHYDEILQPVIDLANKKLGKT
jgi:glutathione S-transferase